MNKSFVFFVDWIPVLELLDTKEEYDELLEAIRSLVLGEEPFVARKRVEKVWSFIEPKLRANLEAWEEEKRKRSEAGRIGGIASGKARTIAKQNEAIVNDRSESLNDREANTKQTRSKHQANEAVTVTVTDTVTVNDTVTGSTNVDVGGCKGDLRSRFTPPSLADVEMFIVDNSYQSLVDPETFFNYYQARGWTVGKGETKMKDWRAALRNWAARERKSLVTETAEGNPFANIDWSDDE